MRKLFAQFFVTVFALLFLIGSIVFVIDPFFHYHAPIEGIAPYMHYQVYQTPGAAQHFTYDSAIVGTSMTENFHASWFEEMDLHTIKLSYSGAHCLDIKYILDEVFESGNDIKYIFMDIEEYQLTAEPDERYTEPPAYLYEDAGWQDAEYLWNNDVFWMAVGRVVECAADCQPKLDDAYTWDDPQLFGADCAKESYMRDAAVINRKSSDAQENDIEKNKKRCDDNLNHIISVIEAHPETEFIIFYPPYSVLYWEEQLLSGELENVLAVYRHSADRLLRHDNVSVFYFQDEEEIITDLDYYRDVTHHTPQINRHIFDCIREGTRELTQENMEEYFSAMYRLAKEYPYEEIWE